MNSRNFSRSDLFVNFCSGTALFAVVATALLSASLFFPMAALADDSSEDDRGRLADGRAFRTDPEGNQLVDYIAELEVTAETLQVQVRGLEDEVREKQATIDRMKSSGATDSPVIERSLGEEKPIVATSCDADRTQITALSARVEGLEDDLQVERQVSEKRVREASEIERGLRKTLEEQQIQLASLGTELGEARAVGIRLSQELEGAKAEARAVMLDAGMVKAELAEVELASAELRGAELKRAELSRTMVTKAVLTDSPAQVAGIGSSEARAAMRSTSPTGTSAGTAGLQQARERAIEIVRGKMKTELNQVRGSVAARDQAFRRYRQGSQKISFKPQPARSAEGASIKDLEDRLARAVSVNDAARVGREASQIRARMNEDIALMKRTMR